MDMEQVKAAFQSFDANGDGQITMEGNIEHLNFIIFFKTIKLLNI